MAKPKTKKVRFLLSPTGAFKLGYNIGEIAPLPAKQADELVDAKYATFDLEEPKEETPEVQEEETK